MALHALHHDARVLAVAGVPRGCRRSPARHGIQGEGEPSVDSRETSASMRIVDMRIADNQVTVVLSHAGAETGDDG